MPEPDVYDVPSFERFTTELIQAGFHSKPGTNRREWQGPAPECFSRLTAERQAVIRFRDGWPFTHPQLIVGGISAEHVSADGIVCLWRDDDQSLEWTSWAGIVRRASEWCNLVAAGTFRPIDFGLDAYIGFESRDPYCLAAFDLKDLLAGVFHDGRHQRIHAVRRHEWLIELKRAKGDNVDLAARLFYRSDLQVPPRTRSEFEAALTTAQLERLRRDEESGLDLAVLAWHRFGLADLLILRVDRTTDPPTLRSLSPAPNDLETLRIRAGRDAIELQSKKVVIFGLGSVGSNVALALAECGVGHISLVDADLLRPGNVVRHVGGKTVIGYPKGSITERVIQDHAPWTVTTCHFAAPNGPEAIRGQLGQCDLAVDATGHWPFIQMVQRVARELEVPLVSGALYRGGAIGRVSRQAAGDVPIWERTSAMGFIEIPAGTDEGEYRLETGCASPVNNAPPSSVLALAAAITQVACDLLVGHLTYPAELVDVYRVLDEPPFDRITRLTWLES